jgi:cytochrome c
VPGTKMRFWGIGDERKLAALLAYLRTQQDVH